MVTPDPREVAVDEIDVAVNAYEEATLNSLYCDRDGMRAAIAADHQWLAEHADEAVKQAVEHLWACVSAEWYAEEEDELERCRGDRAAAETALLALVQPPVVDDAAVERAARRLCILHWGYENADSVIIAGDGTQQWVEFEPDARAALEAFVGGGGEVRG